MNITKHIPNFITCLNLFAGCVSCVMAFQGEYLSAAFFLYLAAAFDFLDGMMARLLNAYSKIGKELDSLSDVVSFGVAPGVMLFSWLQTIAPERLLLPYLAFLIPVSSALRLATFNIDDRQATAFIGLPTPANAIFITSLISYVSLLEEPNFLSGILSNVWIIILLIVVLSFFAFNAFALDAAFYGEYDLSGRFINNITLGRDNNAHPTENSSYWYHYFLMGADINIDEFVEIGVRSTLADRRFGLSSPVYLGDNGDAMADDNPGGRASGS